MDGEDAAGKTSPDPEGSQSGHQSDQDAAASDKDETADTGNAIGEEAEDTQQKSSDEDVEGQGAQRQDSQLGEPAEGQAEVRGDLEQSRETGPGTVASPEMDEAPLGRAFGFAASMPDDDVESAASPEMAEVPLGRAPGFAPSLPDEEQEAPPDLEGSLGRFHGPPPPVTAESTEASVALAGPPTAPPMPGGATVTELDDNNASPNALVCSSI